MDSFIFYILIGVVWIFQLIAKKKREAERRQRPKGPEPERDIFDDFNDLMEKGRQADSESYPEPPDYFEEVKPKIEFQKAGSVEEHRKDETKIIEPEKKSVIPLEEPVPARPLSKEFLIKKIFDKHKPEVVETLPASYVSDLSADVLEQGVILSVILGPPKAARMIKRMDRYLK